MEKSKKTEITKDRIMAAALQEFGTKGYPAASLNNICNTGISKGLLYHNFENKDALYLACVKQCFDHLSAYLLAQGQKMTLSRYLDLRLHFFQENPHLAKLFFESVLYPPAHLAEQVKALQKDFDLLNRSFFEKVLEKIPLRPGVTVDDAMGYFIRLQHVFHGSFSGPLCPAAPLSQVMDTHEASLAKLLDFMLYGIAERGDTV